MGLTLAEAQALFDRRRAAWLAEDVAAYLDCFAEDVELEVPGRTVRGHSEYEAMVRSSFAWARPVEFEFHHLAVGEPDETSLAMSTSGVVMADWTITAERRRDGVAVQWRGMSVCGIGDGRIRWWREYYEDPVALGRAARG